MNTLLLPQHTRARLMTHGSALDLSPMEPQPPDKISEGWEWDWNERDGAWILDAFRLWAGDHENPPGEERYTFGSFTPPHKPGDVVCIVGVPGTMGAEYATCESVTPLRLAEISEEQARECGFTIKLGAYEPEVYGHPFVNEIDQLDEWWCNTHPSHPWQTSYAWMRRWVLEKAT